MLRPKPLAWSGVKSGVLDGTSDVTSGARGAQNDVRSGARVQLPVQLQARVQLPAQLSNSTGPATSLTESVAQPPRELQPVTVAARPFAVLLNFLTARSANEAG